MAFSASITAQLRLAAAPPRAQSRAYMLAPFLLLILALAAIPTPAHAHVGSPDIYADANAGPYRLFVTIRPPLVIPGVAEIEVRADNATADAPTVSSIQIAPIPLTGEASLHPPVADPMTQAGQDRHFYTGALWIMASGSWQVRFSVNGSQGKGILSIPVPATSSSTLGMNSGLAILLGSLGLLLVAGVVGIVGAAARDAQLPPGAAAQPTASRRAMISMSIALVLMIAAVFFGHLWWLSEADSYSKYVYKPLTMQASLLPNQILNLKIEDPGWLKTRKTDDFVLDHNHLMHLYLIRQPGLDVVYHLHPEQIAPAEFQLPLPSIPAGQYNLYADVVHATGFPETLVAHQDLPQIDGRALTGDDAKGTAPPILTPTSASAVASCPANPLAGPSFHFPDGYTMLWNNASRVAARSPQVFAFSLLDPRRNPPSDMALYMGMMGHAAFVKEDGTVFAHLHPSGTSSMAALMMAAAQNQPKGAKSNAMANMPGMENTDSDEEVVEPIKIPKMPKAESPNKPASLPAISARLPNSVGFPYGLPTAGAYRIFVQMKHGDTVETGAFDACATPAISH